MRLHSFMVVRKVNAYRLFMSFVIICEMLQLAIFNNGIDSSWGMRVFGSFHRIGILNDNFDVGIAT